MVATVALFLEYEAALTRPEHLAKAVVAFDFRRQVAFVKFIGTHAEYDRINASTVSQY